MGTQAKFSALAAFGRERIITKIYRASTITGSLKQILNKLKRKERKIIERKSVILQGNDREICFRKDYCQRNIQENRGNRFAKAYKLKTLVK